MRRLLESAQVGHLGTTGSDGRPHVVPVCFALVGDAVYSAVDHKPKHSARLRRIANIEATAALAGKYPQYAERPPSGPAMAIEVGRWSGWSAI